MHPNEQLRSLASAYYWSGFLVFLAVAVFFLWTEHRAHLLGVLPYAILLVCPLMHFLMHRRHRHK